MSGHSKWSQIKHQKEIVDKKRGQVFSKALKAISIAARGEPNPQFNPKLRSAIQKAKDSNVPTENIEKAIKKASETSDNIEELIMEAYGPGGTAILIEAITDNRNRTVTEIKHLVNKNGGKWAEPGSVRWAFEKVKEKWISKFPQKLAGGDKKQLEALIKILVDHQDVQEIHTNAG